MMTAAIPSMSSSKPVQPIKTTAIMPCIRPYNTVSTDSTRKTKGVITRLRERITTPYPNTTRAWKKRTAKKTRFRALRQHADYGTGGAFLWALGFCLFFASMDEGRQWFYFARESSIGDVVLDMSGAGLAGLITCAVWRPRSLDLPIPGIAGRQTIGPE